MKFGRIQVGCMANIFNMCLDQCWRLETSSKLFDGFIKLTTWRNLAIFNSRHLPFLIVPHSKIEALGS